MPHRSPLKKSAPIDIYIGAEARRLRELQGISVSKMARNIGFSKNHYTSMEKGRVSFRVSTVFLISEFLNVDAGHFLSLGRPEKPR